MVKDYPKNAVELQEKIILAGGFLEAYEYLMKVVQAKESMSLIIRGNFGYGKKTLIDLVEQENDSDEEPSFSCVRLNPYHQTDDYSAVKYIARELGLKPKLSIQDTLKDIAEYSLKYRHKIVIVLQYFDVFCRQKQTLLYCLTDLTQHGYSFNVIGLTCSIDPLASLEKRIRSRLNANFYQLRPYKTKQDYIDFASAILGGYKFTPQFEEELEALWWNSNRSIRRLKKYLLEHCSWNKRGALTLLPPKGELSIRYGPDIYTLKGRLEQLTRLQLDLLILGVAYVNDTQNLEFSTSFLGEYALKHNYQSFDPMCDLTLKNANVLVQSGLFKEKKLNQATSPSKSFSIGVLPIELKFAIENNERFRSLKLDPFWKRW